jgi:hypothetical protein
VARFEGIWQFLLQEREKWIVRYLRIFEMDLFRASTSDRCENSVTLGGGWWQMEAVHSSQVSEKINLTTWYKNPTHP